MRARTQTASIPAVGALSLCFALALANSLGLPAGAATQPDPATPQESEGDADANAEGQPGATPQTPPEFSTDERAIETARRIFDECVQAYRNAPAVSDTTTVRSISTFAGRSNEESFDVPMILALEAARLTINKITFTAIDNTLYGESGVEEGRRYVRDYVGGISSDLFTETLYIFPIPQLQMMYADDPLQSIFIATLDPTLGGYREIIDPNTGVKRHEIRIDSNGDGADVLLQIDQESKLIRRFYTVLRDPNVDENDGIEIISEMMPEVLDELPVEDFLVETEGRRSVSSVQGLFLPPNASDLVNQPSPVYELPDIDGEFVHSDALAGHAMVIAFWQIAHEGLLPVLPAMDTLAEWVEDEGRPVGLVAINVGDPPDRLQTFWTSNEYDFRLLVDADVAVARDDFLIGMFPTVFVIAPDGVIHSVHVDFALDADIAAILKEDIAEALNKGL